MFAALFVFALFVTAQLQATEIPSYIHPCSRKDPNYDQCIVDNLISTREKVCTGMPEFNIPPIEPLLVKKMVIYDTDSLKLHLKDTKIYGFCDFAVNFVHTNSDRLHIDFELLLKALRLESVYEFDIRILVPLANKGLVTISTDNVALRINIDAKVATKNGKKEIYASKINSNLNITDFEYKFDETEKNLVELHQAISNVVDGNKQDILVSVKPAIEKRISETIILLFNNINRFNYEKLFSEHV
ncbi:uncharacterized protein LOC118646180 [Monomorium pharaonis]|uniref:uncharacterized protein LOC105836911 n=1 Tax=Monomorium pharaonis TaxID=307658 RepID=UPI00063F5EDD|nr:uncharacterized protein LOC105836911 [Monomorium pharaonis]XP_036144431.1 uncharacterized protein LOC118646180 [Monomorium pharaonis]